MPPPAPLPRLLHGCATLAAAALATLAFGLAHADPRWGIVKPLPDGKQSPLAGTPLQKHVAEEIERIERYPVERIEVEGFREREFRREPPRTAEQRFADALNQGSPEMIAGKYYDGYYFDGTLFWASDPISFAYKNISHWLKH